MEPNKKEKFSVRKRIVSFKYALNGLRILFSEEHNARIHFAVTIFVVTMGILFSISSVEWMILGILTGMVFSLEIINSAIENLCDYISPEWNNMIKKIKDLMAAAVFITTVISVVCGTIIFLPKIYNVIIKII